MNGTFRFFVGWEIAVPFFGYLHLPDLASGLTQGIILIKDPDGCILRHLTLLGRIFLVWNDVEAMTRVFSNFYAAGK
jgi:hypothetical protein